MLLANVVNDPFQPVQHPLRVIIPDLQVLPAALPVKLNDAPQPDPGTDPVYLSILRQLHSRLPPGTIDADLDQVCISSLSKDIRRHIVDKPAVNIPPAVLHGFIPEPGQVSARQQEILELPFRDIGDAQLQFLKVRQGKCNDTEFFPAAPDPVLIHVFADQPAERPYVHAPLPQDPPQLAQDISQLLLPLEELPHPFVIH